MKRAMSMLLIAAAAGAAFADTPDKFVEYVESSGVQYVDAGIIGRSGTKALPALENISLANGALTVAAEAASLGALDLATGTRCDLGGGAHVAARRWQLRARARALLLQHPHQIVRKKFISPLQHPCKQ